MNLQRKLKIKSSLTLHLHGNRKTNIDSVHFVWQVRGHGQQPTAECLTAVDSKGHQTEEDGDSH